MAKGTEALESKPKAKTESKPAAKSAGKRGAKSGKRLVSIHTHKNDDGSFQHVHHYADANGIPDMNTPQYGSATIDDLHDHMDQHFGGGADPTDAGAPQPEAQAAPDQGE